MFLFYSKRYDPRDPDKNRFGHRPVMKYITKLSCGHITERLQMDSGNLIKYELVRREGGSYTLTVNGAANCRGRAEQMRKRAGTFRTPPGSTGVPSEKGAPAVSLYAGKRRRL